MTLPQRSTFRIIISVLLLVAALLGALIVPKPDAARARELGGSPATPGLGVFGTGVGRPQTIIPAPTGDFYVVDTDSKIWSLPGEGGSGTPLATPPMLDYSLRDGVFLPRAFGSLAGQFLIVGGVATTNTPAHASTMDGTFMLKKYASQDGSLWSSVIIPTGFEQYARGVLVVNQGSGQNLKNGSVDYFAPDGSVGRVADLPEMNVPYGGVMALGFGAVSGTLLVSDARSGNIYSVNSSGGVSLFTTIPLGAGQTGLRQMAFAPHGWGSYSKYLFVSIVTGEVAVVNKDGAVVAKISGFLTPRGLRFTDIEGEPSLLIADTGNQPAANPNGKIWKAGLEDIVPVP